MRTVANFVKQDKLPLALVQRHRAIVYIVRLENSWGPKLGQLVPVCVPKERTRRPMHPVLFVPIALLVRRRVKSVVRPPLVLLQPLVNRVRWVKQVRRRVTDNV